MRNNIWRGFFLVIPFLTVALIGVTFTVGEPFPTLLMPGFSRANELSESPSFERVVFVVGEEASQQTYVSAVEFAQIDFGQSQSLPIMNGIRDQLPDLDSELRSWVHERLARLVPDQCDESVEIRFEQVTLNNADSEFETLQVLEAHSLGRLRCGQ